MEWAKTLLPLDNHLLHLYESKSGSDLHFCISSTSSMDQKWTNRSWGGVWALNPC